MGCRFRAHETLTWPHLNLSVHQNNQFSSGFAQRCIWGGGGVRCMGEKVLPRVKPSQSGGTFSRALLSCLP